MKTHKDLAIEIIQENQYLALATSSENTSWSCTVTYATDENVNIYFMSDPNSRHTKDFQTNNVVSVVVYDSTQEWGKGLGVQLVGIVEKVSDAEKDFVKKLFFERNYPFGGVPHAQNIFLDAINDGTYFFYKLTPQKMWVSDPESDVDGKVEVEV